MTLSTQVDFELGTDLPPIRSNMVTATAMRASVVRRDRLERARQRHLSPRRETRQLTLEIRP